MWTEVETWRETEEGGKEGEEERRGGRGKESWRGRSFQYLQEHKPKSLRRPETKHHSPTGSPKTCSVEGSAKRNLLVL